MPKTGVKGSAQIPDSFSDTCASILSGVVNVGLLGLLGLFPLRMHDAYFDMLETKYKCYYMIVMGMLALAAVLSLVMMLIDVKEYKGEHTKEVFKRLSPAQWPKTFCITDAAILVFWIVCLISTLRSDYLYEAFWGNEGRYSGLFLITLYVTAYFLISRLWKSGRHNYQIFLVVSMAVCLLGISDYFQMNLFHLHDRMSSEQISLFTSTFGNINTYTAYVAIYMGFAAMMFATAKNHRLVCWYYLNMLVSFFAIIMGQSDNAYLALGALFGFAPFALFRYREGTQRYLVMLASFATVLKCIGMINRIFAKYVIKFPGILKVITGLRLLPAIAVLLWLAAAGYYILFARKKHSPESRTGVQKEWDDTNSRIRIGLWTAVCAAVLAGAGVLLWMANSGAVDPARFGSLKSYLVFNDSWGTNRGYIWRKSMEIFRDFSVEKKLLGYGPDTFGIITVKHFLKEMNQVTGQTFDSAHNEYLQYLVTIGILGTGAYVFGLVSSCVRMGRRWKKNPYIAGALFAVLCYGIQAFVNLNLPVVTPMLWTILSMGMAECRRLKP